MVYRKKLVLMVKSRPQSGHRAASKPSKGKSGSKSREARPKLETRKSAKSRDASRKKGARSVSSDEPTKRKPKLSPARKGVTKIRNDSRRRAPQRMDEEKQPKKATKRKTEESDVNLPVQSDSESLFSEKPEEVPKGSDESLVESEEISVSLVDEDEDDDISEEIKPKKRNNKSTQAKKATTVKTKAQKPIKEGDETQKSRKAPSKKPKRDTGAQSELIRDEQRKTLGEMVEFFMVYLKDKNEPGITVNSLLKFMKLNSIQGKDRKMEIDDNIAERMVLHLLKMIGITPKYSKPEELVISAEQLRNFVMSESRFHLGVMKKVLGV